MPEALTRWLDEHGVSREADSPAVRVAKAKARDEDPPSRIRAGVPMSEVGPEDRCDRCDHPAKYHWNADRRGWIGCQIASGPKRAGAKAPKCWCDGFVVKARTA